jgi:hypothetical protein
MTFQPYVPIANHPVTDLSIRVQNLEAALAVSMNLLQSLAEKLESRLGPGFLGEELEQFAAIGRQSAEQVAEIDRLVKENQQPAAARVLGSGPLHHEPLDITAVQTEGALVAVESVGLPSSINRFRTRIILVWL